MLRGKLLTLRPLRSEDFQDLYAVASDPLIWEQHPQPDRYEIEVFTEFFRGAMECGGALLACGADDGQVVGSSRFDNYDQASSEVEIGWTFLARSHWGGNYNREMKHLMLLHAFRFVDNAVFLVGPDNLRSQRAVEKIGGSAPAGDTIKAAEIISCTGSPPQPIGSPPCFRSAAITRHTHSCPDAS